MRRREFITLIGGAAASPLAARAQQPKKTKRIAIATPTEPVTHLIASYHPFERAIYEELSRQGFVEGKTLVVERYSGGGQTDRFPQMVRDIVDTRPDAIFSHDAALAYHFKATQTRIPIIIIVPDPVAMRFVPSIAHPGGISRASPSTLG